MAIVDGLITLADARKSIYNAQYATAPTTLDSEIEDYVTAATPVIEGWTGPLIVRSRTFTFDGGREAVVLPVHFSSVTSIVESGTTITDYTADGSTGVIRAGSADEIREFEDGTDNIVVTVSVGSATIPANVKTATKELVRYWWQQGRQANRPGVAEADTSALIPGSDIYKRVNQLLRPTQNTPGFA